MALRILSSDEESALSQLRAIWWRKLSGCLPTARLSQTLHRRTSSAWCDNIFLFLTQGGVIPDDWLGRQIARADVTEGDVRYLSARLAQIRTYTYAAHRQGWTRDGAHWQGITRAVEDRLSDAPRILFCG